VANYVIDNYVQTKSFTNPNQKGFQNYFASVYLGTAATLQIYLKELEFVSDSGLLLKNEEYVRGFQHDYNWKESEADDVYFYRMMILFGPSKDIYYRNYLKLQDLAAQVGGIMKALSTIIWFILTVYNENLYRLHLFNNLFTFGDGGGLNRLKSQLSIQSSNVNIISNSTVQIHKNFNKPQNEAKKPITFSLCQKLARNI
jgi:hypothetical protein